MKFRVLQEGDKFYPEYCFWSKIGFRIVFSNWMSVDGKRLAYGSKEEAIERCKNFRVTINKSKTKVVWTSDEK